MPDGGNKELEPCSEDNEQSITFYPYSIVS